MIDKTNFVHLHVHSDFSICESTATVKALADRAEELGMTHLALTDHGNMFGIMEFLDACEKRQNPIKPIIGCEVYVTPGSRFNKNGDEKDNRFYHLVLLAANREGYLNLMKICSLSYIEGFYFKPRVDDELLVKYHNGLIALSGYFEGEIPCLIREGAIQEAEQKAVFYQNLFGKNNFYLEIQDQGISTEFLNGSVSQKDINSTIFEISRRTGIPFVATNDVHYLKQEDAAAHDALLCIGTGKRKTDKDREKYYGDQFYFKSDEEMTALFSEYPEAIANTVRIAERCVADVPRFDIRDNLQELLPDFEVPVGFGDTDVYLRYLTSVGLAKRYPKEMAANGKEWKDIQKRAEYELFEITRKSFSNYFLIVADYVNWAKAHNIPIGPGRGSAASSIVAYALGITNIDPIKYNLLFERFSNPLRIEMPDFDIDFGNDGRDNVINYITEKYGRDHIGQIIIFEIFHANEKKLEGLHRNLCIHPTGLVLSKLPLIDSVPLCLDQASGAIAIQSDLWQLETWGLVKFDFLGLKILDMIKYAEDMIRDWGGEFVNFSIENIPDNDPATFALFEKGKTGNVFQFSSDGMKEILKQVKPERMTDLIALNALYRPGPMEHIQQFIDSKNGKQKINYPDPCLEDILKETYGVIVYQEQLMLIAQRVVGYSLGEADCLRRALMKKKIEIIKHEKEPFITRAVTNGFRKEQAADLYDMLIPFAGYSFNKSHAAAYTMLAYQTAYLKANFPKEFQVACRKYRQH